MRFFYLKYLLLLLGVTTMSLQAAESDSCYECRCEPLYECSWGVQFDAGVRPIIWSNRNDFNIVNCQIATVVNDVGQLPKFSRLYHLPWQIGGRFSYAASCNTNLFVEFNYVAARAKHNVEALCSNNFNLTLQLSRYRLYEGYFGARYYFDRWNWCWDRVSLFLGGKIGFLHHKAVNISFAPLCPNSFFTYNNYTSTNYRFFNRNTVFAGGGLIGLDVCLTGDWSFVVTAEVVANGGPKSAAAFNLSVDDQTVLNGASYLVVPAVGTEVAFPVTFGFKYNF